MSVVAADLPSIEGVSMHFFVSAHIKLILFIYFIYFIYFVYFILFYLYLLFKPLFICCSHRQPSLLVLALSVYIIMQILQNILHILYYKHIHMHIINTIIKRSNIGVYTPGAMNNFARRYHEIII